MLLKHTLHRHTKNISAVAISPDCSLLLSGGNDARALIWNLHTGELLQEMECMFEGPVSAMKWITPRESRGSAFIFGCADGTLHLYQRTSESSLFSFLSLTKAHTGEIQSLDWDPRHERLASAGGGSPQVWSFQGHQSLKPLIASPPHQLYVARSICFVDDGASVLVCYLESHQMHLSHSVTYLPYSECYMVEPWSLKWSKQLPTRMRVPSHQRSYLSHFDSLYLLLVTNLVNGINRYKIPTMERVQTITHAMLRIVPLQV
ncbi:WD40-repeat-containing domain protein, partial [Hygrophoropsis aurantiaca]